MVVVAPGPHKQRPLQGPGFDIEAQGLVVEGRRQPQIAGVKVQVPEGSAGRQPLPGRVAGRAVADLCNYFNPDLVVVGGEMSAAADLILEPMREAVRRFAIAAAAERLSAH